MAVAKSYVGLEQVGEPFEENKRMYVTVIMKNGNQKKVRWYTDTEAAKFYGEAKPSAVFNARHAFGFGDAGYITIYKGNEDILRDWLEDNPIDKIGHRAAWYNLIFRFYTPSFMDVPTGLPADIVPIRLNWDEVKISAVEMKPNEEVAQYVNSLIHETSSSTYQGTVGSWFQQDVVVATVVKKNTHYGEKSTFTLIDAGGNNYQWETGTKNYEVGQAMRLNMKVKSHSKINNVETTIVWYCKEI